MIEQIEPNRISIIKTIPVTQSQPEEKNEPRGVRAYHYEHTSEITIDVGHAMLSELTLTNLSKILSELLKEHLGIKKPANSVVGN